jgi:hypothetical protein
VREAEGWIGMVEHRNGRAAKERLKVRGSGRTWCRSGKCIEGAVER